MAADETAARGFSAWDALRLARLIAESWAPREVVFAGADAHGLDEELRALGIGARFSDNAGETPPDALTVLFLEAADFSPETARAPAARAGGRLLVVFMSDAAASLRADVVRAFLPEGFAPDYARDLTGAPFELLALTRENAGISAEWIERAEQGFAHLLAQRRELERRLETRLAQLESAQRRSHELDEKKTKFHDKWKEAREKLEAARAELAACKKAASGWLGRLLLRRHLPPPQKPAPAAPAGETSPPAAVDHHEWFLRHRAGEAELAAMARETAQLANAPLFSIVLPAAQQNAAALEATAASLRAQVYARWELCVIGAERESCGKSIADDARVTFFPHPPDAALKHARGEWIGFLDAGDVLEPSALFECAKRLQTAPEAEILYSDEDRLGADGRFSDPFFKPDWSPETFLSTNFLHRLTLLRRELFTRAGGLPEGFAGAWEYDLLLRATELAAGIFHIPKILCHAAAESDENRAAGVAALDSALARRGIAGAAEATPFGFRVKRRVTKPRKISIVIPNRDRVELLKRCIESIEEKTDYPDYEIVVVDNDSTEAETHRFYRSLRHRVLHYGGTFNYSAMNNYAVAQTDGEWLLFLNNDMEAIHAGWLTEMAGLIQDEEIGAVGAMLLYPGDLIQHDGVVVGILGAAGHAWRMMPADAPGARGQAQMIRNYSAVTAACLLTRRAVFERAGGFDEKQLPVALNDIDLCLKIRALGLRVVCTPHARLYHHESASRGARFDPTEENRVFKQRWADVIARDPFYNPNLTLAEHDFSAKM